MLWNALETSLAEVHERESHLVGAHRWFLRPQHAPHPEHTHGILWTCRVIANVAFVAPSKPSKTISLVSTWVAKIHLQSLVAPRHRLLGSICTRCSMAFVVVKALFTRSAVPKHFGSIIHKLSFFHRAMQACCQSSCNETSGSPPPPILVAGAPSGLRRRVANDMGLPARVSQTETLGRVPADRRRSHMQSPRSK